jgi:hypothetical protein
MAKIISINPPHEILIEDSCIIRCDDEFISIEILNGFNWHNHTQKCEECNAFKNSFGKSTYQWLLEFEKKYYTIDLLGFGEEASYFTNLSKIENSKDFWGTKLRFKVRETNKPLIEAQIIILENDEQYERCTELINNYQFIDQNEKG